MHVSLLRTLFCCGALALAGCTNSQVDPGQYSGFLKNYSQLKPGLSATGSPVMIWLEPNVRLEQFTSVYIEPSQLYPRPQPTAVISADTLQAITRYLDTALKREVGKVLQIAQAPGPDTLIVRPAITAVSSQAESLKAYEILPVALLAAAVNTAAGGRDQAVELAIEAAFIDSANDNVIAQVVRKGSAEPLENEKTQLTLEAVRPVLDGWASDMRMTFARLKREQGR
jgi:hypothetical protein